MYSCKKYLTRVNSERETSILSQVKCVQHYTVVFEISLTFKIYSCYSCLASTGVKYVLALVNIGCVTEAVCGPSMAQLNLFTVTNSPNTRIMAALTERGMMSWLSLQWFCRLLEGRMTSGKSMWKKITLIHFKFMSTSHQGFFFYCCKVL